MSATWRDADRGQVLALLSAWARRGWLREIDRAFASFLVVQADAASLDAMPGSIARPPEVSALLVLAAALASHQLGRGHVCLDVRAALEDPRFVLSLPPDAEDLGADEAGNPAPMLPDVFLAGLTQAQWLAALDHPLLVAPGPGNTPLVLRESRLYLRRYWQYEREVRAGIETRLGQPATLGADTGHAMRTTLDILFPAASGNHTPDWQKLACALAARSAFSVITGGPGTGKTTTVVKLLALIQSFALNSGPAAGALRIRLAAPTGKAAARLNETIAGAVHRLSLAGLARAEQIRAAIPTEVTTLHRLLGSRPDTRHFRHNARHPLSLDVLVIDEASMVDLEMMACVLSALPAKARLVLLGDKDQLSSVEAGAVLGELCAHARQGRYTTATGEWLRWATGQAVEAALIDPHGTPLDQAVAMLRRSHRFTADSGIGRVAEAVNQGDVAAARAVWNSRCTDLCYLNLQAGEEGGLRGLVLDGAPAGFRDSGRQISAEGAAQLPPGGYRHYLDVLSRTRPSHEAEQADFDQWAKRVLVAYGQFQVLCAVRRGDYGVITLNTRIESMLDAAGLIDRGAVWYIGRPVLVTRNDYGLGLMNGDVGVTLALPPRPTRLDSEAADRSKQPNASGRDNSAALPWITRVAFLASDGSGKIRWILPSRLQSVETVFAMTVHKSQGSEFAHAALVLPDRPSPILTRELVYTGITRARQWFTLASAGRRLQSVETAMARRVSRASGLMRD